MEYVPKASDDELNEPGTDFDINIGSIHTNILTRVNEAFSQTGGLGEGGDKDKCFVQQMIPARVTSVALAVGKVMQSFLKKMPKPADIVKVDRSPVVQNLQRNRLLMRYENDRLEQRSPRETVKVVGLKEEGEDSEQKVLGIFKAVGADITQATIGLATSSRSSLSFARPSASLALACEERPDDSVCGGGVPVSGQSGVSVTEGGTGDTLFLSGQNGHGPDADKQVSLGLHLTAAGGIHDPIPKECSCECVSYACVRADSSGNSVQMGRIVTEYNAVTKKGGSKEWFWDGNRVKQRTTQR